MNGDTLTSFLFALVAALASVAGGVMATKHKWATRSLRYFIALGAGFMLGAVFIEMVPESIELRASAASACKWILAGYLIVHAFEHAFASHFHFGEETHHDEVGHAAVEFSALVGLLVHTFFDGVSIGAAGFLEKKGVEVLVFLAVFLHKIPDGFTISSIFVTSGHSSSRALWASIALGVSTLAGYVAVNLVSSAQSYALPLATGTMLYVAATDLMPEANRESGVRMALLVFAGVALFFLTERLVGH